MNNNQNTATRVINICLLFLCFGAFIMLNSSLNKEKFVSTEGNVHTFQVSDRNTTAAQTSTIVSPEFNKFWIAIDSNNKHYVSDIRNNAFVLKLNVDIEFKVLRLKYLELKQIIFEDIFYCTFRKSNTDYSVFS